MLCNMYFHEHNFCIQTVHVHTHTHTHTQNTHTYTYTQCHAGLHTSFICIHSWTQHMFTHTCTYTYTHTHFRKTLSWWFTHPYASVYFHEHAVFEWCGFSNVIWNCACIGCVCMCMCVCVYGCPRIWGRRWSPPLTTTLLNLYCTTHEWHTCPSCWLPCPPGTVEDPAPLSLSPTADFSLEPLGPGWLHS